MHNYVHNRFPFSFNETWIYNYMRNPDRVLRNANDLYVPGHHFATVKRFPLLLFPQLWNEEDIRKLNPSLKSYCKLLKASYWPLWQIDQEIQLQSVFSIAYAISYLPYHLSMLCTHLCIHIYYPHLFLSFFLSLNN
jgi:hypothetical protein